MLPMTQLARAAVVAGLVVVAAAPDDKQEVAKAAEKTGTLENYKFKGRIAVTGWDPLPDPIEITGQYAKDQGFTASMGSFGTIFRLDKKVAVRVAETGRWVRVKAGEKIGEGSMASEIPIVARGLKSPHEELKKIEDRFKEIKKKDGVEKVGEFETAVYEGPLTEAGVRALLPAGVGLLLGKGTFEGTGRIWVGGPEGRILRFESDCKVKVELDGTPVEFAVERLSEFFDVGKAAVEMPGEVRKLFEE